MQHNSVFAQSPQFSTQSVGYISNGGSSRYLLEAQSSTGSVAWKLADGTILISNSAEVSLPASALVSFWSCAGYTDSTPAGDVTFFDCHGNGLTSIDVWRLSGLRYLDCSFNRLTELPLDGLLELEVLVANDNLLTSLEVQPLHRLRVLNCANNQIEEMDFSELKSL